MSEVIGLLMIETPLLVTVAALVMWPRRGLPVTVSNAELSRIIDHLTHN